MRSLGLSNWSQSQLSSLLDPKQQVWEHVRPVVNQLELHPGCAQQEMVDFCLSNGVFPTAWGPLDFGRLSGNKLWPSHLTAQDKDELQEDPFARTARKLGLSRPQLALRWNLLRGVAVIPASTSSAHIRENLAAAEESGLQSRLELVTNSSRDRESAPLQAWHQVPSLQRGGFAFEVVDVFVEGDCSTRHDQNKDDVAAEGGGGHNALPCPETVTVLTQLCDQKRRRFVDAIGVWGPEETGAPSWQWWSALVISWSAWALFSVVPVDLVSLRRRWVRFRAWTRRGEVGVGGR